MSDTITTDAPMLVRRDMLDMMDAIHRELYEHRSTMAMQLAEVEDALTFLREWIASGKPHYALDTLDRTLRPAIDRLRRVALLDELGIVDSVGRIIRETMSEAVEANTAQSVDSEVAGTPEAL